jgi:hypothetical protein
MSNIKIKKKNNQTEGIFFFLLVSLSLDKPKRKYISFYGFLVVNEVSNLVRRIDQCYVILNLVCS